MHEKVYEKVHEKVYRKIRIEKQVKADCRDGRRGFHLFLVWRIRMY